MCSIVEPLFGVDDVIDVIATVLNHALVAVSVLSRVSLLVR